MFTMLKKGLVYFAFIWVVLNRASTLDSRAVCGKPILNSPGRIHRARRVVGGQTSLDGAYPWHVIFYDTVRNVSFGGGSIISSRWIVTAAHMVMMRKPDGTNRFSRNTTKLVVGTTRCNGDGGTTLNIDTEIVHPGYNATTFHNDIALVRVKEDIKFTPTVQPICLGSQSFNELEFFSRLASGYIAGCGSIRSYLQSNPLNLMEVKLPIQPRKVCNYSLESAHYRMTESIFCAGFSAAGSGDACFGDAGGGFVVKSNTSFVLVGVVSWGIGCDTEGQYGFYTDVGRFLNWIHLNSNFFPKSARTRISSVVPTSRLRPEVSASVTVDTSTVDDTESTDILSLYRGLGVVSVVLMIILLIVVAVLIRRRCRGKNGATKPETGITISTKAQNERRDSDYLHPIPAPYQMGSLQSPSSSPPRPPSELAGHYEEIDVDQTHVKIIDTIAQNEGGNLDYDYPIPEPRRMDGRNINLQTIRGPSPSSSKSPDELPGRYQTTVHITQIFK